MAADSDPYPSPRSSLLRRCLSSVRPANAVVLCASALCAPALCAAASGAADPVVPSALSGVWFAAGILIGLAGAALFTILDHALFAPDPDEIEAIRLLRPRAADLLVRLRGNLDRTWFTLLAGYLVFGLLFALSLGGAVMGLLGPEDEEGPRHWAIAILVAIPALLVFGEILPGLAAAKRFKSLAPFSATCVRVCSWVLLPLTFPALAAVRGATRLVGIDAARDRYRALEVEKRLLAMVGVGETDVSFEEEEREMIDHALEFGESKVGDIMTPRDKIVGFDIDTPQQEALERMRELAFSRVMVYDGSVDRIVGVLHAKKLLLDPATAYRDLLGPPLFVSADLDLIDLIPLMRRHRSQIVVVLDAYGATAGIVTMDDLLEAIVGELPL